MNGHGGVAAPEGANAHLQNLCGQEEAMAVAQQKEAVKRSVSMRRERG
jgi:hypothetical protein